MRKVLVYACIALAALDSCAFFYQILAHNVFSTESLLLVIVYLCVAILLALSGLWDYLNRPEKRKLVEVDLEKFDEDVKDMIRNFDNEEQDQIQIASFAPTNE